MSSTPSPELHRRRPLHALSILVLAVSVALLVAGALIARRLRDDTEQRLLDQHTAEAGSVLSVAVSAIQAPLATTADVVEATNADPAPFQAAMASSFAAKRYVSAAVYAVGSTEPVDEFGEPLLLPTLGVERVRAMLDGAVAQTTMTVTPMLDQPTRRIGYAYAVHDRAARYVVYVEGALGPRTDAPRTSGAFSQLVSAIYVDQEADADLISASVADLPLHGRRSTTNVDFGDHQLLLVASPRAHLGGSFLAWSPWLIAIGGAALGIAAAALTERLLRERMQAERLARDVAAAYESERHRNETLQRSLLPRRLVGPPGTEVAGRYWPADRESEVGGDFYDVVHTGDHRWAVMIGDVCGKGIDAAALTSVARHTLRAAALHVDSPTAALTWAHEAIKEFAGDTYCTVCFATLGCEGEGGWRMELAVGGHPRPVLARRDGTVEVLGQPGTLLGLITPHIESTTHHLSHGDTLVFYTDGVTDAPGDAGVAIGDLRRLLADRCTASPDEIADEIWAEVRRHRPQGSGDDTALLVLRL